MSLCILLVHITVDVWAIFCFSFVSKFGSLVHARGSSGIRGSLLHHALYHNQIILYIKKTNNKGHQFGNISVSISVAKTPKFVKPCIQEEQQFSFRQLFQGSILFTHNSQWNALKTLIWYGQKCVLRRYIYMYVLRWWQDSVAAKCRVFFQEYCIRKPVSSEVDIVTYMVYVWHICQKKTYHYTNQTMTIRLQVEKHFFYHVRKL